MTNDITKILTKGHIMPQENTHDKCKNYSLKDCPIDLDKMQQTNNLQSSYGKGQLKISFATDGELNKICKDCKIFIQK